jgi:hypothetical protein
MDPVEKRKKRVKIYTRRVDSRRREEQRSGRKIARGGR